ncbi:MAG: DNA polymerase IV (DinB-like DNA polymerase) [Candidatus Nanohaloarchaea archaeon]|jgi:DNA polymerase IV (DinB-like DNA polymerase)
MSPVLHVDMDAFYASVEAERRGWKGEPIVVCVYSGRSEDSGAVSTCSYEARDLGIHAAMPIKNAKRIAEDAGLDVHFIGMDKEFYDQFSDDIREQILEDYTDIIEKASIDEFYLELNDKNFTEAEKEASEIKKRVKDAFGVTCSIGVAPNKLVAKIASDREKPDGLTIVREEEVGEFMNGLEVDEIHGVGERTREKLSELGINSVEELAKVEAGLLVREFGEKQGPELRKKARGEDESDVEESLQKQVTRITTLDQNSRSFNHIRKVFPELADDIEVKLGEMDVDFGSVIIIAIDTDLEMHTRSTSLKTRVRDREIIIEKGEDLLEEFLDNFDGLIRRVGLRVSKLKERKGQKSFTEFT